MKAVLIALLASAVGATKWHELSSSYTFEDYKVEFGKRYKSVEDETSHRSVFEANLRDIMHHNKYSAKGWKHGVNKFTDLTQEEMRVFKGINKGEMIARKQAAASKESITSVTKRALKQMHELPASLDWREHGVVTAVKNQGHCGSCWAFSSTATIESHVAINTGLLFDLSPQQMVSCVPNPKHCGGTGGCSGATLELAMGYVMSSGGLVEEYGYSYTSYYGVESQCDLTNKLQVASIEGYHTNKMNDQLELINAIQLGPVAITVDASNWGAYEGGVFSGCNMTNPTLDHGVVLVGYGTDDVEGDYWLVRNSWSPTWGEKGYIRLKRTSISDVPCGVDIDPADGVACEGDLAPERVCGFCGILYDTVIPLGAKLANQPSDKPHP